MADLPVPTAHEMRADLAAALEVDDANGVWLWPDLLGQVRRDVRLAKALPVKQADVEQFGLTQDRLNSWLEENGWTRTDDGSTSATVWRALGTTVVTWVGDNRSIATAINIVARVTDQIPHDVLVSIAAVRVDGLAVAP